MKKKFKFNSAAVIMAGIFSLLAILGTVFSIKSVVSKADSLPPSVDYNANIPSLYGFNIRFSQYDLIGETDGYDVSTAFPLTYPIGYGQSVYQFNDSFPVYIKLNPDSTVYTRFDLRSGVANVSTNEFSVYASYVLGDTYCDESIYKHFFGGISLSLGGSTVYQFPQIRGKISLTVVGSNPKTGLGEETLLEFEASSTSNNRFLSLNLPTWTEFLEQYGYNGYVCVRDCTFYFRCPAPYFQDYISFSLNHLSTPISTSLFEEVQESGAEAFAPLQYRPVDDIGLNSIINAINSFLNTEFIPGFRLWYFLLFGLGTALLFFFLKVFLGG